MVTCGGEFQEKLIPWLQHTIYNYKDDSSARNSCTVPALARFEKRSKRSIWNNILYLYHKNYIAVVSKIGKSHENKK
jgi:hypothetical protein